jgi:hypothetical protein
MDTSTAVVGIGKVGRGTTPRRQPKTRFAISPCRRATSAIEAPGTLASATNCSFCSSVCCRTMPAASAGLPVRRICAPDAIHRIQGTRERELVSNQFQREDRDVDVIEAIQIDVRNVKMRRRGIAGEEQALSVGSALRACAGSAERATIRFGETVIHAAAMRMRRPTTRRRVSMLPRRANPSSMFALCLALSALRC